MRCSVGIGRLARGAAEARVIARKEAGQEGVGSLQGVDAGQAQGLDEAILQGLEGALDATLGLGTE